MTTRELRSHAMQTETVSIYTVKNIYTHVFAYDSKPMIVGISFLNTISYLQRLLSLCNWAASKEFR